MIKGYRKIALIRGYIDRTTGRGRLNGYLKALREAGIPKDDSLIKIGNFKKSSGINLARELLENPNRPEAIFVANIDMTLGTLIVIKEIGLKIPSDVGIVGFDDPDWNIILDPPLTAVDQPVYNLGSTAAELLIKKIEGEEKNIRNKPLIITLNTNLIIRSSTKNKKVIN